MPEVLAGVGDLPPHCSVGKLLDSAAVNAPSLAAEGI